MSVFICSIFTDEGLAESFKFMAIQSLKHPNDIIISHTGHSGAINQPAAIISSAAKSRAALLSEAHGDATSLFSGQSWSAELSDFNWQPFFRVSGLFVGYWFQVEVKEAKGISYWMVAGLAAINYLLSTNYKVSDQPVQVPATEGGSAGAGKSRICVITSDRNGVSHLRMISPPLLKRHWLEDDKPPEEDTHGHSGGDVCSHPDCFGKGRCKKAGEIEQQFGGQQYYTSQDFSGYNFEGFEMMGNPYEGQNDVCGEVEEKTGTSQNFPGFRYDVNGDVGIDVDGQESSGSWWHYGENDLAAELFPELGVFSICDPGSDNMTSTLDHGSGPESLESLESQISVDSGFGGNAPEPMDLATGQSVNDSTNQVSRLEHGEDQGFIDVEGGTFNPTEPQDQSSGEEVISDEDGIPVASGEVSQKELRNQQERTRRSEMKQLFADLAEEAKLEKDGSGRMPAKNSILTEAKAIVEELQRQDKQLQKQKEEETNKRRLLLNRVKTLTQWLLRPEPVKN
ncbi:hypothetical protein GZ77_06895 [Endozoicomonas montiporae]|uniref:BHLH domain-containing protein n=2 Tax=Endozoicomonas montiporae TaxID=1027273 RepID=A0A081N6U4_9GAMM|nr:hypothetical protein GZ77_06895 [Endozoicomonas montiporae]